MDPFELCSYLTCVFSFLILLFLVFGKVNCKNDSTIRIGSRNMSSPRYTFSDGLQNCLGKNAMNPSACCSAIDVKYGDCDYLCDSGTGLGSCTQCPSC